ncbi:MAG: phosphohistidine phosphatase SixA [Pseudobdellovibrionaceae bacterium]|nr:phosphohistidine phosphatase SixA [Bdellovibrionales bacterium]USN48398.1 MAG: phosphohistidine phosphatase SixA [Pseudobdellovibrionaceae bacterium]
MRLLIVRHAIAESRDSFMATGESDEARPLTKEGMEKMADHAAAMHALFPEADQFLVSPLRRAQQTAEILIKFYKNVPMEPSPLLKPTVDPVKTVSMLSEQENNRCLLLVGHQPHLGDLVGYLLTGQVRPMFDIKKGAIVVLDFDGQLKPGRAHFQCLMQPKTLRRLCEKIHGGHR